MGFKNFLGICSILYLAACGPNESERIFPIADLNGDNHPEKVLVRERQGSRIIGGEHYDDPTQSIHVAFSNRDRSYQLPQQLAKFNSNYSVVNVRLNDYYGKGHLDLVILRKDPLNNTLTTILENDGKGGFKSL